MNQNEERFDAQGMLGVGEVFQSEDEAEEMFSNVCRVSTDTNRGRTLMNCNSPSTPQLNAPYCIWVSTPSQEDELKNTPTTTRQKELSFFFKSFGKHE